MSANENEPAFPTHTISPKMGLTKWEYAFIHAPQLEISYLAENIMRQLSHLTQTDAYLLARERWANEFIKRSNS